MNRYPAPNSCLVLDNASVHKGEMVLSHCIRNGVRLLYLPPYSPDYNPIEKGFFILKSYFWRKRSWGIDRSDYNIIREAAWEVFTPDMMAALYIGSGYENWLNREILEDDMNIWRGLYGSDSFFIESHVLHLVHSKKCILRLGAMILIKRWCLTSPKMSKTGDVNWEKKSKWSPLLTRPFAVSLMLPRVTRDFYLLVEDRFPLWVNWDMFHPWGNLSSDSKKGSNKSDLIFWEAMRQNE